MHPDRVERKLATILAADVAGYSRLMGDAEEATHHTLRTYREVIGSTVAEHRGRVFGGAGDSVVAEFASPVEAVRCAFKIQHSLAQRNDELPKERRMRFRIGINLGDVIIDGDDLLGDGVNVAARLEGLADPGGICVSATIREQVHNKLDLDFEDLGVQTLKNIPEPVRAYRVLPPGVLGADRRQHARTGRRWRMAATCGVLLTLLAAAIAVTWPLAPGIALEAAGLSGPPIDPPLPEKPSIVVLPFTNMSGDPEQEYFSDGMTEDLTTDLSRNPHLFVISRNSAFVYKGKAVKIEQVGRELGVRYVLEGSVRRADGLVRITAQLIDAASGFHVWSQRYDRELKDIFVLQSEISEEIMAMLKVEIGDAELERVRYKPTDDLNAYDAAVKGLYHLNRATKRDNAQAQVLFERAIELDPDYANAHALLGQAKLQESGMGWRVDPTAVDRAEALAKQALQRNPSEAAAHNLLAQVNISRGRAAEAIAAAETAVSLNPNDEWAHTWLGASLALDMRLLAAMQSLKRALRLNPRAPSEISLIIAYVNWGAGQEQQAVDLWEQLRAANPDMIRARVLLASHYQQSGRPEEARAAVDEILAVNPAFNADLVFEILPNVQEFLGPAESEKVRQALRAAGMP